MNELNNQESVLKQKNKSGVLVIILSIIIVLLIGYILIDKLVLEKNEEQQPSSTNTTTTTTTKTTAAENQNDELTSDEIISLLKEYSKVNGLYDESNTEFWNITDITYLGHYKEDIQTKYFVVNGTYKCKDNSVDCVYVEQSMDDETDSQSQHIYKGGLAIKGESVSSLLPTTFNAEARAGEIPNFSIVDQKLK